MNLLYYPHDENFLHPDPEILAHSQKLQQVIQETIKQAGGQIPFALFMELALYTPNLGYYMAGLHKLGSLGDFITAPELSSLFSRCLSHPCQQVLNLLGSGDILEFGAGSGRMAADLLSELERKNSLPARYLILEISADLRQRQQETLYQQVPHLVPMISWLDQLPDNIQGVVIANEVCDAMPVHCFQLEGKHTRERYVSYEKGQFIWRKGPLSQPMLSNRITEIRKLINPVNHYESEINLAMECWVAEIALRLQKGMLLIIDYGFPQHEYYHWERAQGTLMCHYRHRAHSNPLILPGLQDITAHVNFTALAEAGYTNGLKIAGYCSQADFLLSCGLDKFAESEIKCISHYNLEINNQIKRLILPSEMGELFKALALTREIEQPILGFSLRDRRSSL